MQIMCVDHSPRDLTGFKQNLKLVMSRAVVHCCRDPGKITELARLHGCDILMKRI